MRVPIASAAELKPCSRSAAASSRFTRGISAGPWTAKAKGTMSFKTGATQMTLNSPQVGSITARCKPKPAALISQTTVS